ncbi:unnamed protein product [Leptosia nina]|uniref:Uncharacterized protein n=1 Tax=Leptosia nina TaxID=320188 RepID=A0AAV1JMI7_9NEOP
MKGGLCVIYTSLLTISILSSCALFILVVSEALQVEQEEPKVDLSGLHNVSKKTDVIASSEPAEATVAVPAEEPAEQDSGGDSTEMIFPDTISVNSVTTDGILCVESEYKVV